jgi:hypothetical protein
MTALYGRMRESEKRAEELTRELEELRRPGA